MKVIINDNEMNFEDGKLFEDISEFLNKKGLIPYEIMIGDRTYYQLETIEWDKIKGNNDINIVAVNGIEYCLLTLKDAVDYIERLVNGLSKVMEYYRDDDVKKATIILKDAIDGISWVNNLIVQIEPVLGLDYQKILMKGGDTVSAYYQKYSNSLDRFTNALEDKDYFMAADIIEYEVIPAFKAWQIFFKDILEASEIKKDKA